MSTTVSIPSTIHRSRWGYHPISYEDFKILKYLRSRYWKAFFMANKWARWGRKATHNRRGPQPPLDPQIHDLGQAERFLARNVRGGELHGYWLNVPKLLQDARDDHEWSRMPKATPEEVTRVIDMAPYREIHAKLTT